MVYCGTLSGTCAYTSLSHASILCYSFGFKIAQSTKFTPGFVNIFITPMSSIIYSDEQNGTRVVVFDCFLQGKANCKKRVEIIVLEFEATVIDDSFL